MPKNWISFENDLFFFSFEKNYVFAIYSLKRFKMKVNDNKGEKKLFIVLT